MHQNIYITLIKWNTVLHCHGVDCHIKHSVAMYLTWYAKHLRVACLNIVLKECGQGRHHRGHEVDVY